MKRQKQADKKSRDRFIMEDLESSVQQTNMEKAN